MAAMPLSTLRSRRWRRSHGRDSHLAAITLCSIGTVLRLCIRSAWPLGDVSASSWPVAHSIPPRGSCAAAATKGRAVLDRAVASWQASLDKGSVIPRFGRASTQLMDQALKVFDQEANAAGSACESHRAVLQTEVREAVDHLTKAILQLAQDNAAQELRAKLLREMRRRRAPLRVKEKIEILRSAVDSYKRAVQLLLPTWIDPQAYATEQGEAERHLGTIQFTIEDSAEGVSLQRIWEQKRNRQILTQRAHGIAVSLDPELRVMLRPEGIGNLQVFSSGHIGPPNFPATMNIGVLNDGSIADVYREHPTPPFLAVQPAVKVKVDVR